MLRKCELGRCSNKDEKNFTSKQFRNFPSHLLLSFIVNTNKFKSYGQFCESMRKVCFNVPYFRNMVNMATKLQVNFKRLKAVTPHLAVRLLLAHTEVKQL